MLLRLGTLLAGAGTGSYRVREAMRRVAAAMGIDEVDANVTTTFIALTARRGEEFRTVVREISSVGVDAGRISALEAVAAGVRPGVTAASIDAQLTEVTLRPPRWGVVARSVAAGVACATFALLNGFDLLDAVAVFWAAALGQALRMWATRRHVAPLAVVGVCSAVSCLVYLGAVSVLVPLGGGAAGHGAGFVAALLYLVPGFPLFTGLLDLAHLDVLAGAGRLVYASLVVATSGGVAWLLSSFTGAVPLPPEHPATFPLPDVVFWGATGLVGVGAFAVLFDARLRIVLAAGAIGSAANVVRLGLTAGGAPVQTACFCAGLVIGLLAAVVSHRVRVPRITVSVPAALIMIPGPLMYRALYHLNTGAMSEFVSETATVVLLLAAIGAGLALARLVTDPAWTFDHCPSRASTR